MARLPLKKVCLNCWQSYPDPAETICRLSCGWVLMRVPVSFKPPADGRAKAKATAKAKKAVFCCPKVGCPELRVYPQVEPPGSGSPQKKTATPQCFACETVLEGASIYLWLDKVGDPSLKDLAAFSRDSRVLWKRAETAALLGLNEHDALNLLQQTIERMAGVPFGVLKEWVRESVEPFVDVGTVTDHRRWQALDSARVLGVDAAVAEAIFDELTLNLGTTAPQEQTEKSAGENGAGPGVTDEGGVTTTRPEASGTVPAPTAQTPATPEPVRSPGAEAGEVKAEESKPVAEEPERSPETAGGQPAVTDGGVRKGRSGTLTLPETEADGQGGQPRAETQPSGNSNGAGPRFEFLIEDTSLASRLAGILGPPLSAGGRWLLKTVVRSPAAIDKLENLPHKRILIILEIAAGIFLISGCVAWGWSWYKEQKNKPPHKLRPIERSVPHVKAGDPNVLTAYYKDDEQTEEPYYDWQCADSGVKLIRDKEKVTVDTSELKNIKERVTVIISLWVSDKSGKRVYESAEVKVMPRDWYNHDPSNAMVVPDHDNVEVGIPVRLTWSVTDPDDRASDPLAVSCAPEPPLRCVAEPNTQNLTLVTEGIAPNFLPMQVTVRVEVTDSFKKGAAQAATFITIQPLSQLGVVTPPPEPPAKEHIYINQLNYKVSAHIGEDVALEADADDLDGPSNNLIFSWSTTAGLLRPVRGRKVTLHTGGIDPSVTEATVSLRVIDRKGGEDSRTFTIKLYPPSAATPQAQSSPPASPTPSPDP